jgi:hypothetical protein
MSTEHPGSADAVGIRDRRELPFFQVRLHAVKAIREVTAGPRRLRAIGFYALLCRLANEQRHVGAHRTVRVTYQVLASRGQMSKRSIKVMLDALQQADVVRYERLNDADRGAVVSLLHLLVHDGAWTAITVAMADHLARPRSEGHLLRDLGLVVVLLEFCAAQRDERGGLSAEVMRGDIAEQSGLTIDRVDDCNRVLEQAGLLDITRRRAANGGRHLPSLYTIHEAPTLALQRGETELAAPANGSGSPVEEYYQGGAPVPPGRTNGTGSAASRYRQSGDTATASTASPPSNARASLRAEEDIENLSSLHGVPHLGEGGDDTISADELCEALVAAWEPALGATPADDYAANRARWLDAAASVLSRHTRPRLQQALGYMVTDEILGSQALNMPGFAKVADQLIARAYARQQRLAIRSAPPPITGDRLGWEDAKQRLQRAIQRHGREGRGAALRELGEQSPLLARFVEQVRWGSLCEQPFQYVERRYAELWRELLEQGNEPGREHAA